MRTALERLLGRDAVWELAPGSEAAAELLARDCVAAAPGSAEECAAVLRLAAERGLKVVPYGGGRHQRRGNLPGRADVVLFTGRMRAVRHYDPADQTLAAEAGTPLAEVHALARRHGQFLPFDPPGTTSATIGGALSAGVTGPLRTGYGPPRDYVLGSLAAHPDGTVSRSGGRLVKNVTGFDLHRTYCGAMGWLAVLCEVNLRLLPLPERERTLVAAFDDLERLDRFLECFRAARGAPAAPAALMVADARSLAARGADPGVQLGDGRFLVFLRFHGSARATAAAVAGGRTLLEGARADDAVELEGVRQEAAWILLREFFAAGEEAGAETVLALALLPMRGVRSRLGGALEALVAQAAGFGASVALLAEPLLGRVRAGFRQPPPAALLAALQNGSRGAGEAYLAIESAPPRFRRGRDVALGFAGSDDLALRLKRMLDPGQVLAPGRFAPGREP